MSALRLSTILCGLLLCQQVIAMPAPAGTLNLSTELTQIGRGAASVADFSLFAPLALRMDTQVRDSLIRNVIVEQGLAYLGTPYRFGGTSRRGVDCSALVQNAYESAGIPLPRTTTWQVRAGASVTPRAARVGDLMFYRWKKDSLHIALNLGDGKILHASPSRGKVIISQLNRAWNSRLVAVRRVL